MIQIKVIQVKSTDLDYSYVVSEQDLSVVEEEVRNSLEGLSPDCKAQIVITVKWMDENEFNELPEYEG